MRALKGVPCLELTSQVPDYEKAQEGCPGEVGVEDRLSMVPLIYRAQNSNRTPRRNIAVMKND